MHEWSSLYVVTPRGVLSLSVHPKYALHACLHEPCAATTHTHHASCITCPAVLVKDPAHPFACSWPADRQAGRQACLNALTPHARAARTSSMKTDRLPCSVPTLLLAWLAACRLPERQRCVVRRRLAPTHHDLHVHSGTPLESPSKHARMCGPRRHVQSGCGVVRRSRRGDVLV
jgi:hypothetical protein